LNQKRSPLKLQSDNNFIQNKKVIGSTKTPVDLQRQQLDFLLTALYQPITQAWLKKHPAQEIAVQDLINKDSLFNNSLASLNARKTVWIKGLAPVSALFEKTEEVNPSGDASAVYLRLWETSLQDTSAILRQAHQMLTKGGALLMELINFSGFKAYPYHFSFTRAVELIGNLETDQSIQNGLPELLKQIGFERTEKVYSRPTFLPKEYNQIISVCLEAFRQEIILQIGTSREEIDALLSVLKHFEEQEDTLICQPGVHLVQAIKK
jgi:hypothetical protein